MNSDRKQTPLACSFSHSSVPFIARQVEQQLQQINRSGPSSKWTIAEDCELLAQYWTGVAQARIQLVKNPKKSAKDRLKILKMHLTDNWYNLHTQKHQPPQFSDHQARLYVYRAMRSCLRHINDISDNIPPSHRQPSSPPSPPPSYPPSPPPSPPRPPPCNHPKHVELWNAGFCHTFPCASLPPSPLAPAFNPSTCLVRLADDV
eukprot:3882588-Prymnesium_polylepis.1